jgi:hypothetical protein
MRCEVTDVSASILCVVGVMPLAEWLSQLPFSVDRLMQLQYGRSVFDGSCSEEPLLSNPEQQHRKRRVVYLNDWASSPSPVTLSGAKVSSDLSSDAALAWHPGFAVGSS